LRVVLDALKEEDEGALHAALDGLTGARAAS
jgi:hypothetical protein